MQTRDPECVDSIKSNLQIFNNKNNIQLNRQYECSNPVRYLKCRKTVQYKDSQIILIDFQFNTLSKITVEHEVKQFEELSENLVATIQVNNFDINLYAIKRKNVRYLNTIKNGHQTKIKTLKSFKNGKFASFSENEIKIWNTNGDLLKAFDRESPSQEFFNVDILTEEIFVLANNSNKIEIWNYQTGCLLNKISNSFYLGSSPFGFFTRKKESLSNFVLFYSHEGTFKRLIAFGNNSNDEICKLQHKSRESFILISRSLSKANDEYQLKKVEFNLNGQLISLLFEYS